MSRCYVDKLVHRVDRDAQALTAHMADPSRLRDVVGDGRRLAAPRVNAAQGCLSPTSSARAAARGCSSLYRLGARPFILLMLVIAVHASEYDEFIAVAHDYRTRLTELGFPTTQQGTYGAAEPVERRAAGRQAEEFLATGHGRSEVKGGIIVDVGIGLPTTIPNTEGKTLVEWASRAEEAGFSTLGTIGRLVYPNYDDLIALAAAAAVTDRIRLTTSILIAPLHANSALLAKQAASLDRLSSGRLVVAVGLGGRDDDYEASGLPTTDRGRRLDEGLQELKRIWSGEERGYAGPIGPTPARPGGPELIVGGHGEAAFQRAARVGDGWIMGGGPPEMFAQMAGAVDEAWQAAGRSDRPRKLSLAYFALGGQGA